MKLLMPLFLMFILTLSLDGANGKGSDVSNNIDLPNGQPFITIKNGLNSLQDQIDAIALSVGSIEERVDANSAAIAALEEANALLQEQSDANSEEISSNLALIHQLQEEILSIKQTLDMKQNILNAQCPDGMAINTIHEDGSIVCEDVSGSSGTLIRTMAFSFGVIDHISGGRATATCPSDYIVSGGGYMKGIGTEVYDNYPTFHGNTWRVRGVLKSDYPYAYDILSVYAVCLKR